MTAPLVIACGALASELRAVLAANGLADAVEVTLSPGEPAQPARTDRARARAVARSKQRRRADRCSSATPIAEPAAPSTRCSNDIRRRPACRAITATSSSAGSERVRRAARGGARAPSSSPTSWPSTSTRCCGRGSVSTAIPNCCDDVLRQLPARRADLADRGSGGRRRRARRGSRRLGLRVRAPSRRSATVRRRGHDAVASRCRRGSPDAAHRPMRTESSS